jgi:crossover junction endodeoxyribonuclease RuvC
VRFSRNRVDPDLGLSFVLPLGYPSGMIAPHPIRILGIDPGLRKCGWGVIETLGSKLSFIACGSVNPSDKLPLSERLKGIHDGLSKVMTAWVPDEAAIEETFVNKDARATLKLGAARGVAMVVPALTGISVAEYAPNQVKKSVVGAGHAEKQQIRLMIGVLLPKADPQTEDAADALAIAICHAHMRQANLRILSVMQGEKRKTL